MSELWVMQAQGCGGQPDEIAHVIVFLALDDASFVTGHILSVDGGKSAVDPHGRARARPSTRSPWPSR
jgi:NAD(P)-dependent dehydrogenase (short-subunit alcohol dehydrogenase family)